MHLLPKKGNPGRKTSGRGESEITSGRLVVGQRLPTEGKWPLSLALADPSRSAGNTDRKEDLRELQHPARRLTTNCGLHKGASQTPPGPINEPGRGPSGLTTWSGPPRVSRSPASSPPAERGRA